VIAGVFKMAKKSKVTNTLSTVYDQMVSGVHYVIKPNESIVLDRGEAVNLVGHFCGDKVKVGLNIEHLIDKDEVKKTPAAVYFSPDGKEHPTKEACLEYMKKK
jgi:hypothetical protein